MNVILERILLWAHLLCMVGTFGSLLITQLGLPKATREDPAVARACLRFMNFTLLVGLVFGVATYVVAIRSAKKLGGDLPSEFHMVIGIKFMLLFLVAAFFGMASGCVRKDLPTNAHTLMWAPVFILAGAALLGIFL